MNVLEIFGRLPYNPKLKERAIKLRQNMTRPEKILWDGLLKTFHITYQNSSQNSYPPRGGGLRGSFSGGPSDSSLGGQKSTIRVLRQRPIANFIVDFYIPKLKLVIEIDGESHFNKQGIAYDIERTHVLEGLGLKVIRFTNNEVISNFDGVSKKIIDLYVNCINI